MLPDCYTSRQTAGTEKLPLEQGVKIFFRVSKPWIQDIPTAFRFWTHTPVNYFWSLDSDPCQFILASGLRPMSIDLASGAKPIFYTLDSHTYQF